MTNKEIIEQIKETIYLTDCVDLTCLAGQDDEDIDYDTLETYVNEYEVIYYHRAMELLSEHDPILVDSITLANGMGCDMGSINSETLATILFQDLALQELNEIDFD